MYDVFTFTETSYATDDEVDKLENYLIFTHSSDYEKGGVVWMYVKKEFECTVIRDITIITNDFEILTLQHNKTVFLWFPARREGTFILFSNS